MTILSNGNVGIGTTTPTALLDVHGDVVVAGDLTAENLIVGSTNVITEIGTKQATITSATDLDCNSLTTNNLEVNGGVNIDTSKYFDTIVIRRPTGFSGDANFYLGFRELQCWVNNSNIIFDNANDLISNYALWSDKDTSLGGLTSKMYDNTFIAPYDVIDTANSSDIALIIKNIPLTAINTIQSLVLYSRTAGKQHNEGVAIELYNSTNLTEILASTNIITLKRTIHRFDFPSIDTYTGGFATADSITQIINEGDIIIEDANFIPFMVEITGDVVASGSITAENLIVGSTNLITEINMKQDIITDGSLTIARTNGLLTALDLTAKLATANTFTANQSITGDLSVSGLITQSNTIRFKAYYNLGANGATIVVGAGNNIPYNSTQYDVGNGYDGVNYMYVVPVAGLYFFGGSWFKNGNNDYTVDYQKNGTTIRRNESNYSGGAYSIIPTFVIEDCVVGDEISLRVVGNSIRVGYNAPLAPNGWTHFEGYRIG
jgi:hypothetical protein